MEGKTESFEEWFRKESDFYCDKICLREIPNKNGYRGVFATEDIADDEVLFTVNRSLVLSAENSHLSKLVTVEKLDPWLSLILVVMDEWCRATESLWSSYLDVLPIDSPNFQPLMFWPKESLEELQTSPVVNRIGKEEAEEIFRLVLLPVFEKSKDVLHPKLFPKSELYVEETLLPLYHRAGSVIMAYAFDIEKDQSALEEDEEGFISDEDDELLPKGLIPMADMLNADADLNNAQLFYEGRILSMKATKLIKAGEEIFNDYGALPRSELLRRYGYVTSRYGKFDVADLPLPLVVEIAKKKFGVSADEVEKRSTFVGSQIFIENGYDITHFHLEFEADSGSEIPECPFDSDLINFVNILLLPNAAFKSLGQRGKSPKGDLLSKAMAPEILDLLGFACEELRSKYPSTVDQDLQQLKEQKRLMEELPGGREDVKMTNGHQSSDSQSEFLRISRYCQALEVRLGEKKVLQKAELYAREMASYIRKERGRKKRTAEDHPSVPGPGLKESRPKPVTTKLRELLGENP
ncbi:MAG: hypothetical protein Q9157_003152 [Trypethelium eluteriae]